MMIVALGLLGFPAAAFALTIGSETILKGSDVTNGDRVGDSLAADGDTIVAGGPLDDQLGMNAGVIYVFAQSGSIWSQQAKITAPVTPTTHEFDLFGFAVDIDGDTLVATAPGTDVGAEPGAGAAYVFVRTGTTWSLQATLAEAGVSDIDSYGISVAISGDTIAIGASNSVPGFATGPGAVYVYTRTGSTWTKQATLSPSDGDDGDLFGRRLALDGDELMTDALYHLDGTEAIGDFSPLAPGTVYVFNRTGSVWNQTAKLVADDRATAQGQAFGDSISLDGGTAAFGAPVSGEAASFGGAVYVFTKTGATWSQAAKLTASDAAVGDSFGGTVALLGNILAVGADGFSVPLGGANPEGAAYVFERSGTWSQQAKLLPSVLVPDIQFGGNVAVGVDYLAAAAPHAGGASPGVVDIGAVYVFDVALSADADLSIAKTADPDPVGVDGLLTYTITVTNNGPENAADVSLSDPLPAGLIYVSSTPSQGTCGESAGTVTCALGTILNGASATVSIVTLAPSSATLLSNTASVSSPSIADPSAANDSVTLDTGVLDSGTFGFSSLESDISVSTSGPANGLPTTDATYTVTITNGGPDDAPSVTFSDTLPAGTSFVSATTPSGICSEAAGTVACGFLGDLVSGDSYVVTVVLNLPAAPGLVVNTASSSSGAVDPVAGNNTDSASTNVSAPASVPSLGGWGFGLLALMLTFGIIVTSRPRLVTALYRVTER